MPTENQHIIDAAPPSDNGQEKKVSKTFHQRSEAAQEIISRQPGFAERWALILFLSILVILIACTWFIKYPDIIETTGRLTADNAPKEIIPLQSGRLVKLFVKKRRSGKRRRYDRMD